MQQNLARAVRISKGKQQTELARQIGWTQPMFSDWERGKRKATPAELLTLARVLEIDPSLLGVEKGESVGA